MKIEKYNSGVPWESQVGYSRAVRIGNMIEVSGTTATNANGDIVGINNAYQQTLQTIKNIEAALQHFSAGLTTVYRTRIYVTDIDQWQEIGRAHNEYFADIRPATAMVEVSRFIVPEMLVEIEAQAMIIDR